MTTAAWVALAVAGVCAVADWIVVAPGERGRRLEYILKPATMVALIVVALALEPESSPQRGWFVAAAILSLAGDVFLMLPKDMFVAGLASFLLAHMAYIVGFAVAGFAFGLALAGVAVVVIAAATVGRRIVGEVSARHRDVLGPIAVYMTVISLMVVMAFGTRNGLALAGALLFYCSDSLIAWDRFVKPMRGARPAIMSTYHLAQAFLIISLAVGA